MPAFAGMSPFAAAQAQNFNPAFSNVPQNKPPKEARAPETPAPIPISTPSSLSELNAMNTPTLFHAPAAMEARAPPAPAMPTVPAPYAVPAFYMPQPYPTYMAGLPEQMLPPQLRMPNPSRNILV